MTSAVSSSGCMCPCGRGSWVLLLFCLAIVVGGCGGGENNQSPTEGSNSFISYNDSLNFDMIYPWGVGKFGPEVHHYSGILHDSSEVRIMSDPQMDSIQEVIKLLLRELKYMKEPYDHASPEWQAIDEALRIPDPVRTGNGSRVLSFNYLFNQEDVWDEESGLSVYFVLPASFRPRLGVTHTIPNEHFQVVVWEWNSTLSGRMVNPAGYIRFDSLQQDRLTIVGEVRAVTNRARLEILSMGIEYDSLMDRIRRSLPIDSLLYQRIQANPDRERTVFAGRVTFVKEKPREVDGG